DEQAVLDECGAALLAGGAIQFHGLGRSVAPSPRGSRVSVSVSGPVECPDMHAAGRGALQLRRAGSPVRTGPRPPTCPCPTCRVCRGRCVGGGSVVVRLLAHERRTATCGSPLPRLARD